MAKIACARVFTSGQSLETQVEQLTGQGCDRIFREPISGAQSDRPQLAKALTALSEGDVFVVTRLERLARSTGRCFMHNTPSLPKDQVLRRNLENTAQSGSYLMS